MSRRTAPLGLCLLSSLALGACGSDGTTGDATGSTGVLPTTTGDASFVTTTGDGSVASTTGDGSEATTTGDGSVATTTGDGSVVTTTGDGGVVTTGDGSVATTGDAGSTGGDAGDGGSTGADAGGTGEDAGGTGTDAAATGTDAGGADTSLCHLEADQVLVLGDSYVALDPSFVLLDQHPFTSNLERHAREAGALGENEEYRDHALSGASMAYAPSIPSQLEDAIARDPQLKLVIMTGGGNDVLVNNRLCLEYETEAELVQDQPCVDVIDNAIAEGQKMIDRGVEVGAEAVIYFFYPHLPGLANGGIGAGSYPNVVLDYAYPKVRAFCEGQTEADCYFIDMRGPFDKDGDGESDEGYINIDGIHPTYESSEILADEVWKVMQRECLASQPAP